MIDTLCCREDIKIKILSTCCPISSSFFVCFNHLQKDRSSIRLFLSPIPTHLSPPPLPSVCPLPCPQYLLLFGGWDVGGEGDIRVPLARTNRCVEECPVSSVGRIWFLKQLVFDGGRGPPGTRCEEERPTQTSSAPPPASFSHLASQPADTSVLPPCFTGLATVTRWRSASGLLSPLKERERSSKVVKSIQG